MNSQLIFLLAVTILVAMWIWMLVAKRRGVPFLAEAGEAAQWNPGQLLLASFLTLFAELAFIRWIAVEVRVFAYFKNLALLLCFLGFGLGCALVRKPTRWRTAVTSLFGLLLLVR